MTPGEPFPGHDLFAPPRYPWGDEEPAADWTYTIWVRDSRGKTLTRFTVTADGLRRLAVGAMRTLDDGSHALSEGTAP